MFESEYLEQVAFIKNTENISYMTESFKELVILKKKSLIDGILNPDWKARTMHNNKASSSVLQFKKMMHVITQI